MIKALLFDVGGVIFPEEEGFYERLYRLSKQVLRADGIAVTDDEFYTAIERCIRSYVPSLTAALIWYFTKPDVTRCDRLAAEVRRLIREEGTDTLPGPRDGLHEVLEALSKQYTLALAGNVESAVRIALQDYGILQFFTHTEVSGDLPWAKPDLRFFEHILGKCGVEPGEALMIGDRMDNDIAPPKQLGMKAILMRVGPYAILEPRVTREIPDAIIDSIDQLPEALGRL